MQLPPGCRLWQATGGPLAWAPEQYFSAQIFHALNIANWQRSENGRKGKNAPEAPTPPKYTHEKKRAAAMSDAKAKRFQRRQELNQRAITARAERQIIAGQVVADEE